MKSGWILLLLLSAGLNLGLGYALLTQDTSDWDAPPARQTGGWDPGARWADHDSATWAEMARHRFRRLADRLDLSEEQQEPFRRIKRETFPRIRQGRQEVRRQRGLFHTACLAAEVDPDEIMKRARQLSAAQARLDSLVTSALLAELVLLEPEQRRRYLQMMPWIDPHLDHPGHERPPSGRHGRHRRGQDAAD
jgi:Spy/CpxP family protein refolding chaperone